MASQIRKLSAESRSGGSELVSHGEAFSVPQLSSGAIAPQLPYLIPAYVLPLCPG